MHQSSNSPDAVLENLDWVRKLAGVLLHDDAAADDLVQDTWLKARSSTPPKGAAGRRWLARVMRNLATDHHRRTVRRKDRELDAAPPEALPTDDELREAAEVRERVARWTLELPEPYRRVALLRYLEGVKPRHIAEQEKLPVATVRSQLARAQKLLRERARQEERGGAAALLAVAAGIPRKAFTLAAVATPIPIAGLLIMKVASLAFVAAVAAVSVLWIRGDAATPSLAVPTPEQEADALTRTAPLPDVADVVPSNAQRTRATGAPARPVAPTDQAAPNAAPPAGSLILRVTDEAGAVQAGAPIAVFHLQPQNRYPLLKLATDANGLAVIEDAANVLLARQSSSPGSAFDVGLSLPGIDLPRVALDPEALPEAPVSLTLPAYGSLEVRITDSGGQPMTAHPWLNVTPLYSSTSEPGRMQRGERHIVPADGLSTVHVPFASAGTALRVGVSGHGIYPSAHLDLDPLRVGEHRVVDLQVGSVLPHVTGRVVLEDGSPIAAPRLDATFTPSGDAQAEVREDGTFTLSLGRLHAEPDGRFSAVISAPMPDEDGNWNTGRLLSGRFDATVPDPTQPTDVGTVVLRPPPVFAAGTVLNEAGEPMEGARISIFHKMNQREDPEDFNWGFAGIGYVFTDEDGRFSAELDHPAGEYAARAYMDGLVDRGAVRFQSGSRNVHLTLDRERHVTGRLQLPDGADPTELQVRARVLGATREENTYVDTTSIVMAGGRFHIAGLRAKPVRLTLTDASGRTEIATLDDIVPTPDAGAIPAKLDPWDVRDDVTWIAFDIELSDGSAATQALVVYGESALPIEHGRVESLAAASSDDEVTVVAPGHRPAKLSGRTLPTNVRLERGLPVQITIDSSLPEVPEGAQLTISLAAHEPAWLPGAPQAGEETPDYRYRRRLWNEEVVVQPGETAWTVHVNSAGSYRPEWRVLRRGDDPVLHGSTTRTFYTKTARYDVEVNEQEPNRRQTVQPDLEAAVEAMRTDD